MKNNLEIPAILKREKINIFTEIVTCKVEKETMIELKEFEKQGVNRSALIRWGLQLAIKELKKLK